MSDALTVGELKRMLAVFRDDDEIAFSGGLTFHRLKMRGEKLVHVEFAEYEAILSKRFQQKFPQVIVAFCREDGDGSLMQAIEIPEL